MADEVAQLLCARFEGATSYAAIGHFTGRKGIHREAVRVVEFFCSRDRLAEQRCFLHELALRLRDQLQQESIALSINGSLVLLDARQNSRYEQAV